VPNAPQERLLLLESPGGHFREKDQDVDLHNAIDVRKMWMRSTDRNLADPTHPRFDQSVDDPEHLCEQHSLQYPNRHIRYSGVQQL
jgi:hypothetical protein